MQRPTYSISPGSTTMPAVLNSRFHVCTSLAPMVCNNRMYILNHNSPNFSNFVCNAIYIVLSLVWIMLLVYRGVLFCNMLVTSTTQTSIRLWVKESQEIFLNKLSMLAWPM